MLEIGRRMRNQPAPPFAVFEALTRPDRDPTRPWLLLLDDETLPKVIEARSPEFVVWSSIWVRRPDARVRFELAAAHGGTDLTFILQIGDPAPDSSLTGHLRKRMNHLINANLRYSFGQ